MKQLQIIIISIVFLALIACESNKQIFVKVYDNGSKKPIDSVHVVIKAGKNGDYSKSGSQGYTDSTGSFNTFFMIGCSFGCYDVLVEFHKKGYAPLTSFNPKDSSIVYLQPVVN